MSEALVDIVIPDRPTFKASEVCDLLKVQPYVLRSWENEFKDLGVAKTPGAPRVYRRADVEMALRIRQLVFADGLTLSGVRRRFEQERPAGPEDEFEVAPVEAHVTAETRVRLERAKQALRGVLELLGASPQRASSESPASRVDSRTTTDAGHGPALFDLVPHAPASAGLEPVSAGSDSRRSARPRKGEGDHRALRGAGRAKRHA